MDRHKVILLLAVCVLWLFSGPAVAAASEEAGGWGWWETVGRWFNLAVLFGVIFYAVRLPAREYFKKRRAEIQREMREAEEARQEADRRMAEMEARMQNLGVELEALRGQSDQEAQAERERILVQAQQEAERILAGAAREIDGLGRSVRKELKEYAAHLAVRLAEERIRGELSESDERRLAERFFSDLSSKSGRLS